MNRRDFLTWATASSAGILLCEKLTNSAPIAPSKPKFKLKYASHFGKFKNHAGTGPIDELKFMIEHGNSKPGKEGEQAVIDAYNVCDRF